MTPRSIAALAATLLACEAEPDVPLCEPDQIESWILISIAGFEASYADVDQAELSFCLAGSACGRAAISRLEHGVECRSDASLDAPRQECMLGFDGTLVVMVELNGSPSELHGLLTMTLELSGPGLSTVSGDATVFLHPKAAHGESCGVGRVVGSVTVDAALDELVTG